MELPAICQKSFAVEVEAGKIYGWCTCGLTQTEPFCDSAHKTANTTLKSLKFTPTENGTLYLCGCRQTKTPPYCDGSQS